jgi:hypothetical protein
MGLELPPPWSPSPLPVAIPTELSRLPLLGDKINTIKNNTEALIDASKDVGLGVNAEKTKYILLSRHQNAGQNHDVKIANRCFENVAQLKYLGTT